MDIEARGRHNNTGQHLYWVLSGSWTSFNFKLEYACFLVLSLCSYMLANGWAASHFFTLKHAWLCHIYLSRLKAAIHLDLLAGYTVRIVYNGISHLCLFCCVLFAQLSHGVLASEGWWEAWQPASSLYKKLGVGLLVLMIWWCFGRLIAPVVTAISIILCFNKLRLTQVHLENGR